LKDLPHVHQLESQVSKTVVANQSLRRCKSYRCAKLFHFLRLIELSCSALPFSVMNQSILTDSTLASVGTNNAWSFDRQSLQQHFTYWISSLAQKLLMLKPFGLLIKAVALHHILL